MNIEMRRGDRHKLRLLIEDANGKIETTDFDEIYFTVKKNSVNFFFKCKFLFEVFAIMNYNKNPLKAERRNFL